MEEKKVSIIIPVYNVEKYIRKCLDSIVSQTYKNLEIIINNDGSTDSSLEICKQYAESDDRIRIFSQENQGLSVARNAVLKYITGDYFLFVDSDDWLSITAVETLVRLKETYNADCVVGSIKRTREENITLHSGKHEVKVFKGPDFSHKMLQPMGYFCFAWCRLFDREISSEIHFPEKYIFEDIFTMPMLIYNLNLVVRTSEQLYFYRFRRTGLSHAKFQRRSTDEMDAYLSVFKFALKRNDFKLAKNTIYFFLTKYYWYYIKVLFTGIGIKEYREKYRDYAKWLRSQLFKRRFICDSELYERTLSPWR